jgi:hypothetical protein
MLLKAIAFFLDCFPVDRQLQNEDQLLLDRSLTFRIGEL